MKIAKLQKTIHKQYEVIFLYKIGFDFPDIRNMSSYGPRHINEILQQYKVKTRVSEETYEDSELCVVCRKKPLFIKKWKMCASCHQAAHRKGLLQNYPVYKTKRIRTITKAQKISDECLTDMINDGFTTAQIARTCNMSRQGVHHRVDIPLYKAKTIYHHHYEIIFLYKIGFTSKEIMQLCSTNPTSISYILNKYEIKKRTKLLITKKEVVHNLYTNGYTLSEIAEKLNIKPKTALVYLNSTLDKPNRIKTSKYQTEDIYTRRHEEKNGATNGVI